MFRSVSLVWRMSRIAAAMGVGLLQGCEVPVTSSKYSAEENGYLSHFKNELDAICKVGGTESRITGTMPMQQPCGMTPLGTPLMCMVAVPVYSDVPINSLKDAGLLAKTSIQKLDAISPSVEMANFHGKILAALKSEAVGTININMYKDACRSLVDYKQLVEERKEFYQTTDSIYLTFQPLPLFGPSLTVDSRDGLSFEVDQSFTVPTQFGDITAGYKGSRGIHTLRVIFDGREKIFSLDRPFEFFIPSGYATRVSYEGTDELILEVVSVS